MPGFDQEEPQMLEMIERVRLVCKANGIAAGIHYGDPAYARRMAADGFDLVIIGSDARFIEAGEKAATTLFRHPS